MLPIKRLYILAFLTLAGITSFAQVNDTTILAKSRTIDLKYSPKIPVTKASITFLKFKDSYGIQILYLTPNKYTPHIFIESIDSLILDLARDKKLLLNKPCPDIKYNELADFHSFQVAYFIDKVQLDKLKKEKVIKIITSHGSRPLTLQIEKKSQKEILDVASSI